MVALCSSVAACDSSDPADGTGGAGGSAPALGVEAYGWVPQGEAVVTLSDGDAIELWGAPQGGHVSRIGARVTGLGTDTALLVARLRDPTTDAVIAEGTRTSPMVDAPDVPGAKQPDPSSMYNLVHLALCPDNDGQAIAGVERVLELAVTELYGDFSEGSTRVRVVPTCLMPPGPEHDSCECECAADYTLGKCAAQ